MTVIEGGDSVMSSRSVTAINRSVSGSQREVGVDLDEFGHTLVILNLEINYQYSLLYN